MMAEKDAAVLAMVAQYRGLRMPNLKLSNSDVAQLIDYVGDETKRHRASLATPSAKHNAGAHHH